MKSFLLIHTLAQLEQLTNYSGLSRLSPAQFQQTQPHCHVLWLEDDTTLIGFYSLWWQNCPQWQGRSVGFLGHYQAKDEAIGLMMIRQGWKLLQKQNCQVMIAPVDGKTAYAYRGILSSSDVPAFFLESQSVYPQSVSAHLLKAGLTPIAHYSSHQCQDLMYVPPKLEPILARFASTPLTIRAFNLEKSEAELEQIYRLVIASFARNFLYTPLSKAEFFQLYQPLLPHAQADLIFIAQWQNQPVGFLLSVPDACQQQRGETINTLILKTVAHLPQKPYRGLGYLLVHHCHQRAFNMGFKRVIHSFMKSPSFSTSLSQRYPHQVIRKYALFALCR